MKKLEDAVIDAIQKAIAPLTSKNDIDVACTWLENALSSDNEVTLGLLGNLLEGNAEFACIGADGKPRFRATSAGMDAALHLLTDSPAARDLVNRLNNADGTGRILVEPPKKAQ